VGWYSDYRKRNALAWQQIVWGAALIVFVWTAPSVYFEHGATGGLVFVAIGGAVIRLLAVWARAVPQEHGPASTGSDEA
jgi:hypothetical protein